MCFSIGYIMARSLGCFRLPLPGRGSSSAAIGRNPLWSCVFLLLIGRWHSTGRTRAALCARGKKTPPEVSINQRDVRGSGREKEKRGVEGARGRPHPNCPTSRTRAHARTGWRTLPLKVWRGVSSESWDYSGHSASLRLAVNTDVCIFDCLLHGFGRTEWIFRRVPPSGGFERNEWEEAICRSSEL